MIEIRDSELFCRRLMIVSEFLENDQVGLLIDALKNYSKNGSNPSFSTKALNYAWLNMVETLDKPSTEEAPKKRGRPKKDNKTENKVDAEQLFKDYLCSDNVETNTFKYIRLFLSTDNQIFLSREDIDKFKTIFKTFNTDEKWRVIQMDRYNVNENYIRNYIKSMDYHNFLKTPWWDAVRSYKRRREDNTCEKCGCTDKTLHIHHPNYEIRGYEDKYIDTLQCLCEDCHKEAHNKKREIDEDFIKSIMLD